jgi:O-antigen ligase
MQRLEGILGTLMTGLIALVALAAPWCFGAWETWWFWPFAGCIFAAAACFCGRLMLWARIGSHPMEFPGPVRGALWAWLPFLLYALVRALQADVHLNAERSVLLHLTPALLALMIGMGLSADRQRGLLRLLLINFALLGTYGILNHFLAGNSHVLWRPGFPQYQQDYHRATGSYFCPDHFAGLMEVALGLALALLTIRTATGRERWAAAGLGVIATLGIYLSRSRGGGLVTLLVIGTGVWLLTESWPRKARWGVRGLGLGAMVGAVALLVWGGGHYVQRFKQYPWSQLEHSDRYQMSAAALRAWRTAPWLGVGPGMHPNLWPHFAPSADGDRVKGVRPRFPNNTYHSFEAHNDWAQFLEEYGLLGLAGLGLALAGVAVPLGRRWRRRAWCISEAGRAEEERRPGDWLLPGVLLAGLAMTLHSVGDFNLQIPATAWLLGILAGLALAEAGRQGGRRC